MTSLQMQERFGIELNQYGDRVRPHSDDIYHWLNAAQINLVESRFRAERGIGFERTVGVSSDLRSLVVPNVSLSGLAQDGAGLITSIPSYVAELPDDFGYLISVRAMIGPASALPVIVPVRIAQQDDVLKLAQDPFNKPTSKSPLGFLDADGIRILTDDTFTILATIINYIKKPTPISEGSISDLPDNVHHELVTLAVKMYIQNSRDLRLETQTG